MAFNASMISTDANIQHIQNVTQYQKVAIDNLKANLASYACMERKEMVKGNGKIMQFYVNHLLAANTVPQSEGSPSAPIANGSTKGTVTVQQYSDHMLVSDFLIDTAISNIVDEQGEEMGYRGAQTVDLLNYTQFDSTAAAITAARIDLAASPTPEYFNAAVAKRAVVSLEAADVRRKSEGSFRGLMHPLVSFDYENDNTAGGTRDILKRNDYGRLKAGVKAYRVLQLDGVDWITTTKVPTTSNYDGGGATAYHSYVIGKDAFFCTSLGGFADVPKDQNFSADIHKFKKGSQLSDPNGLIAAAIGYKFYYATYVPPDSIPRFRRIRSEVSIT